MAADFSKAFYRSSVWKNCKESYIKSVGGLCERCAQNGIVKEGNEVHHIIHLTPDNISDVSVTLNFDNLEYLCHACHDQEHKRYQQHKRRYVIDENGAVIAPQ